MNSGHPPIWSSCVLVLTAMLPLLLYGCATPVFKSPPMATPSPSEVAHSAQRFEGTEVVWGGKIIDVRNLAATTEVQVVAYPLDSSQRPDPSEAPEGRFIVELPGYAEAFDFSPGRFLSVRGHIAGTRVRVVDGHDYEYPVLRQITLHAWPRNFPNEGGRTGFAMGVGVAVGGH